MNLAAGPQGDAFEALAAHTLTAAIKGIPPQAGKIELGAVGRQGWNLLQGDLPFPLAVLSRSALEHNSRWMRTFIETNKLSIAPHGKTTMAPQLFRRQMEDGAWAITVATLQQLMVCRRFGFDRLLIANELIGRASSMSSSASWRAGPSSRSIAWSTASLASSGSPRRAGAAAIRRASGSCSRWALPAPARAAAAWARRWRLRARPGARG
jgi:hypothetical protein